MSTQMYQFLTRVKTFQLGHWLHSSLLLSPYRLSSRGFLCISPSLIQCHLCHIQLSFQSLKLNQQNPLQQQHLLQQLKHHHKDCIYSGENMKDSQVYMVTRGEVWNNVEQIFGKIRESYVFYKGSLPKIQLTFWEKYLQKYEFVFSKNNPKFMNGKDIDLSYLLSIFGWQLLKQQIPKLGCTFCGRSLDVSQYSLSQSQQRFKIDTGVSTTFQSPPYFNPLQNHRYFCIWGHIDDFRENDDERVLYGWEMCLKYLMQSLLDVQKGWAERERYQEVSRVKKEFGRVIQEFCDRTRKELGRFGDIMVEKGNGSGRMDGSEEEEVYGNKMKEVRGIMEGILEQVDGIVKPLGKQIKYS